MTLKEKFHFAKLSLFNIRLLNDFENSENYEIKKILQYRAKLDNIALPINLLNQSSFLSYAYINFVWLWETVKQEQIEKEILKRIQKRFDFTKSINVVEIGKDRNLRECKDFLRLIRNAISHGNVELTKNNFVFTDNNPRSKKNDYGKIEIEWEYLGKLSDDILFSVNDYIYYTESK